MTELMKAVVTTGNGGYDKLVYKDVAMPELSEGEVLIKVLAAGINNTEINTRLGWYSSSIKQSTNATSDQTLDIETPDGGWNKATPFPFIQGTDCCGQVVSIADDVKADLVGKRVLIRSCIREQDFNSLDNVWLGSDFDGAFAEYVKVRASEVFPVDCDWSDAELGTIPCAYGTSENMLHRANLKAGEIVLITGASGGVGSATVQLAKRRGAKVIAVAALEKHAEVARLGADVLLDRSADLLAELAEQSIDLVVDNVAGSTFPTMLKLLKRGGRFVSSGAIAGPVVDLDMRDMYLKDISLIGTTAWDEPVFPNLIRYIEKGEIRPVLAKTFSLADIAEAQKEFLEKKHVGKFVLIP
ncbi:alcohol dehydrogenase family protein [Amphritea balenae]|uniref:NAD-dependent epimerase/dehydratase family protein n=1 Tax=Amphritea balenae TaxID=452629 RepID=A0A3P1SXF9_9GAMM|nr:alcohol dehydrogenase family protein [Amphritea balenae]RRD01665.1 NAD-dependent epimerase/dehydratase family protein [Amphritea balenae]GGK55208.1 alcohol dehydrogenase [Amphritea balenae]